MLTSVAQRWRGGRAVYRPAGTVINPRRYEVAPIAGDAEAREFVTRHHYSGSYPAARERVGLYRGGALVGVAVFSVPVQGKVLDALPCPRAFAVEQEDQTPGRAGGRYWTPFKEDARLADLSCRVSADGGRVDMSASEIDELVQDTLRALGLKRRPRRRS